MVIGARGRGVGVLCALGVLFGGAAAADDFVGLYGQAPIQTYQKQSSGGWSRGETLAPSAFNTGTPVLESSRGYVKVRSADGPVWIDELDARIDADMRGLADCDPMAGGQARGGYRGSLAAGESTCVSD